MVMSAMKCSMTFQVFLYISQERLGLVLFMLLSLNLKLILSTTMGGHQPLKPLGILLPREPCLNLGNIDAQTISDARGANAMNMKLRHQFNLLLRRQRAFAGISDRRVRSSAIGWLHHLAVYPLTRSTRIAMALPVGRYCDIALAGAILPYSTRNLPIKTAV